MQTALHASTAPAGASAHFQFVERLAADLSRGRIELPSFPEVAIRLRQALADERVSTAEIARIIGTEPALSARVLGLANSATLNPSGQPVTELRSAVTRLGHSMLRSAAAAFALAQVRASARLPSAKEPLRRLWLRAVCVAALCYTVARTQPGINADEAFLAGLLHGVGRLYVLSRACRIPALFDVPGALDEIAVAWHATIGRAILENWGMGEAVIEAVTLQDDRRRDHEEAPDLADVMIAAVTLAEGAEDPLLLEAELPPAFAKLRIEPDQLPLLMQEADAMIEAMQTAFAA